MPPDVQGLRAELGACCIACMLFDAENAAQLKSNDAQQSDPAKKRQENTNDKKLDPGFASWLEETKHDG